MKKNTLICTLVALIALSCNNSNDPFLITENSIGPLQKESALKEAATLFAKDSIQWDTLGRVKGLRIFEKGGKRLLDLTYNRDSVPTVSNAQFYDTRYQTASGIGLGSTYKDIEDAFEIKKVVTSFNNIVIFPKGSNLYFTIEKSELPENLRYGNQKIEAVQIPGGAKIKYLMLSWD